MRSLLVIHLFLFVTTASAQSDFGTITGSVSDTAGGPVAGASIQARSVETGVIYKANSVQSGSYTLSQLPPGRYEVTATAPGFKRYERKDTVHVQAGQSQRADIPIGDFISLDTLGEDRATFGRLFFNRPKPPEGLAPRTPDGKPDFSGVWNGPLPGGGGGGESRPELLPWAEALEKERTEHNFKDNPSARCLPFTLTLFNTFLNRVLQSRDLLVTILEYDIPGYRQIYLDGRGHPKDLIPSWTGHMLPTMKKWVQNPDLLIILDEYNASYRQIFLDGRPLPKDRTPTWNGYATGHWDGDTLVVESTGYRDDQWLDSGGSAVTSEGRVTERIRRVNYGTLLIELSVDDPKAYTRPWSVTLKEDAVVDTELVEAICAENEKDVPHLNAVPRQPR